VTQAEADSNRLEEVDWSQFDYLDLGSSKGDSLEYGRLRFGGTRGLGVDIKAGKVQIARQRGLDIVQADATRLGVDKTVRFALMMDFLAHLPNLRAVERAIEAAASAATDFLFVFHPSFEGEAYLTTQGLRLHWWNWRSHTAHIRISDYCAIFERLGLHQYMLRYVKPITDASHSAVLSAEEPMDEHGWDAERHRSKQELAFPEPLWQAQEIFVALRAFDLDEWSQIVRPWKETPLYTTRVLDAAPDRSG